MPSAGDHRQRLEERAAEHRIAEARLPARLAPREHLGREARDHAVGAVKEVVEDEPRRHPEIRGQGTVLVLRPLEAMQRRRVGIVEHHPREAHEHVIDLAVELVGRQDLTGGLGPGPWCRRLLVGDVTIQPSMERFPQPLHLRQPEPARRHAPIEVLQGVHHRPSVLRRTGLHPRLPVPVAVEQRRHVEIVAEDRGRTLGRGSRFERSMGCFRPGPRDGELRVDRRRSRSHGWLVELIEPRRRVRCPCRPSNGTGGARVRRDRVAARSGALAQRGDHGRLDPADHLRDSRCQLHPRVMGQQGRLSRAQVARRQDVLAGKARGVLTDHGRQPGENATPDKVRHDLALGGPAHHSRQRAQGGVLGGGHGRGVDGPDEAEVIRLVRDGAHDLRRITDEVAPTCVAKRAGVPLLGSVLGAPVRRALGHRLERA